MQEKGYKNSFLGLTLCHEQLLLDLHLNDLSIDA